MCGGADPGTNWCEPDTLNCNCCQECSIKIKDNSVVISDCPCEKDVDSCSCMDDGK